MLASPDQPLHHIELWSSDLATAEGPFGWLLTRLGWAPDQDLDWPTGRIWRHPSGVYLVLEQSPAVTGPHDRLRAGLNHLALRVPSRAMLDQVRAEAARHGWSELFADRYPHAGGDAHEALYLAGPEGFEVELVVA